MAVRCQVRLGQVRLGQVRLGQVRLGQLYMYGSQVRCQVRLGQVRLGQDRLGQVRLGQVRLGQVRSLTCTADKIIDHFHMKKFELLHFTVAKKMSVNCSTLSSSCHFFCHLLESGLARINWIRAVYQFRVEQLICCQKCRANDCRAIAFRAVHPHLFVNENQQKILDICRQFNF